MPNQEQDQSHDQNPLDTPGMINALVIVDAENGATFEYTGPYSFRRDGGCWETDIPVDTDEPGGIASKTAESLEERSDDGDIALAYADSSVEASGVIEAADVLDGKLTMRVDDPVHVTLDDVDLDFDFDRSEVDR